MRPDKMDARMTYRVQETQRASDSPSLSDKFPHLKSLTLDLAQYDGNGGLKGSQIKYSVNLKHARSVFRIDCNNKDCVRGDFDLTAEIVSTVAERRSTATGELCCRGWLSKTTIDQVRCGKILRYKLNLEYA